MKLLFLNDIYYNLNLINKIMNYYLFIKNILFFYILKYIYILFLIYWIIILFEINKNIIFKILIIIFFL